MFRWAPHAVAAAIGLWLSFAVAPLFIARLVDGPYPFDAIGQWGDSFGALNALFATLGFGAALVTLIRQQQQFALDKFDSSFFELLKLFVEARDKVSFRLSLHYAMNFEDYRQYSSTDQFPTYRGIDAFLMIWREIRYWEPNLDNASLEDVVRIYDYKIHQNAENTLGPYFRLLYTILSRIQSDKSLNDDDKLKYGNLIRGQLSDHEASLAGLNAMSDRSKDFKRYVRCFRLLKYTTGLRRVFLERFYLPYVFADRDLKPQRSLNLTDFAEDP